MLHSAQTGRERCNSVPFDPRRPLAGTLCDVARAACECVFEDGLQQPGVTLQYQIYKILSIYIYTYTYIYIYIYIYICNINIWEVA